MTRLTSILRLTLDIVLGGVVGLVLAFVTTIVLIGIEQAHIYTGANGWRATLQCGPIRQGALRQAACAWDVSALNVPQYEVYLQTWVDGARHRLNSQNNYLLHFPAGGLPPNNASWSVTAVDAKRYLVDNPIHRYSVGAKSGLAPNADGSIDIYIQSKAPAGHEANWLPAPPGHFGLWLRIYRPGAAVLNGTYHAPPVLQVTGAGK